MKKIILITILFLILILGCTQNNTNVSEKLTKCIASKSTLYVSTGCSACLRQESFFGDNAEYLKIVDCTILPQECNKVDIIRVPTWIINDEMYVGVKSIDELKELTGCEDGS